MSVMAPTMTMTETTTAPRGETLLPPPAQRLSPKKCAFLIGIQVVLVLAVMCVVVREIIVAGAEESYRDSSATVSFGSSEADFHSAPLVSESPSLKKAASSESLEKESLPDCVETGKTKMAKVAWVFLFGALIQSDRCRSIIVAGAL